MISKEIIDQFIQLYFLDYGIELDLVTAEKEYIHVMEAIHNILNGDDDALEQLKHKT